MTPERIAKMFAGSFMIFFGLVFIAVGVFVSSMTIKGNIFNDSKLSSNHKKTKGVLVDMAETNTYINEEMVTEFIYEYQAEDKERVTSYSYHTAYYNLNIGDTVVVEYHPDIKYLSRIKGMRTTEMGLTSLLFLIFPLSGLGIVTGGIVMIVKSKKL